MIKHRGNNLFVDAMTTSGWIIQPGKGIRTRSTNTERMRSDIASLYVLGEGANTGVLKTKLCLNVNSELIYFTGLDTSIVVISALPIKEVV
jgi:hypothetical protein